MQQNYIQKDERVTITPNNQVLTTQLRKIIPPRIRMLIRETKREIIGSKKIRMIDPPEITSLDEELAEMGWTRVHNGYSGMLKGNRSSYEALLVRNGGNTHDVLIRNPSQRFRNGRYRNCLLQTRDGWWRINFSRGKDNPLGQILNINNYIRGVGE